MNKQYFVLILFLIAILGCHSPIPKGSSEHIATVTDPIDDPALVRATTSHDDWLSYGLNYQEDRHSRLVQITDQNVDHLGLAWSHDLGVMRGIEATPLVIDGIMFLTGPWSVGYAINARTGERLWTYDPKVPRTMGEKACCDVVNRGMAIYEGDLFWGTIDGRLVSVDAATGRLNWEIMTVPPDRNYTITGAPRIAKGNIIIGNGGAEYDARGFVTAYDAKSGDRRWRFYTVPGDPANKDENVIHAKARETWTGEYWKMGGGGTVWDAIVYDPELDRVYIGVGNGAPWDRNIRSPQGGDNWFLSSIVALNPDDGSYIWHYQTTPGDTWDYTSTQPLILAELEIEGVPRKVIMQAPKNGFFYVIDRTDGSFISAEAYSYVNWASKIDDSGRPIEMAGARYTDGQNHIIAPGAYGAHNWQPMAFNHETGLVYIPSHMSSLAYSQNEKFSYNAVDGGAASGTGWNVSFAHKMYRPVVHDGKAPSPFVPPIGRLLAWDPINQREVWSRKMTSHWNGGILSTAGNLIFQGNAEGVFAAYDALTGQELWSKSLGTGIIAAPVTYMVDGEQFVSIAVGWGGITGLSLKFTPSIRPGTIYTFKLNGDAAYPEDLTTTMAAFNTTPPTGTPVEIGHGVTKYIEYCVQCHGDQFGRGGGALPDLSRSSDAVMNNFNKIVLEGLLEDNGMPNFGDRLTEQDVHDIKQFMLYTASSLSSGMEPLDFLTSLAEMQYLGDNTPYVKD